MEKLLKKGDRHQVEWQEMPRNRLTWETLQGEDDDETVSIRVCVKKHPRNTMMNVPPECPYWRKFSVMLPSVDEAWTACQRGSQAHDAEEFEEDKRPLLFLACLISGNCLEEAEEEEVPECGRRGEVERTRQYNSMGDILNAFYADSCNSGVARMFVEDDLIRNCFTDDSNIAGRYMALAAAAGTGDLTGRKCKTWTKLNEKSLGTLICLGCKTALSPAGLAVMDDQKSPEKMMKKLDAEYYPQATVVVDEEADSDSERMKEVIITLSTKGGSLTVVTPQFGFNDTVLRTVGLESWHGPGDISIYGEATWLKEWASRRDISRTYDVKRCREWPKISNGSWKAVEPRDMHWTCISSWRWSWESGWVGSIGWSGHSGSSTIITRSQHDQDIASPTEVERMFDQEGEMLEEIPLPNLPMDERERREQRLKLPRATRIAVRKLRRQFGHVPNRLLIQILRASNAKADFIQAARTLRCEGCDAVHPKPQTQKVTPPRPLSFNDSVGVDIFEVKDANGERRAAWKNREAWRIAKGYGDTSHSRAATCWKRSDPTCAYPICDDQEQNVKGKRICTKSMGTWETTQGSNIHHGWKELGRPWSIDCSWRSNIGVWTDCKDTWKGKKGFCESWHVVKSP